ncbi:hypothetical protein HUS23_02550 [Ectothiorhodospiraceae bacterium 2226]|nr:hypothetical protein HUS23_02550 [Ectothiorhodospiraceae bacterium 2226]
MAGHFPFSGRGGRAATTAFFELQGYNAELQEKYYRWWYEWAKRFVEQDKELSQTKAIEFQSYPYGQHAHRGFHLNDKVWAVMLDDLGHFIKYALFPRLSSDDMHKLEDKHRKMVEELRNETGASPREPAPDIGYFRHT